MEFATKNNYIYENLKDDIVEGRLRPGERIVIPEVSNRYNVSPMPVREALGRLQQDGLIEIIPHVGARVKLFDIEQFKEIMTIRIELEVLATRMAIPFINEERITRLETLYQEMVECVKTRDSNKYGKVNKEFHLTIYSAGPYQILNELITSLWARSENSRTVFSKVSDRLERSIVEHRDWLDAIKEENIEKATQVLRKQKESAIARLIEELEEGNNNMPKLRDNTSSFYSGRF